VPCSGTERQIRLDFALRPDDVAWGSLTCPLLRIN
jgi:hypothetical protein